MSGSAVGGTISQIKARMKVNEMLFAADRKREEERKRELKEYFFNVEIPSDVKETEEEKNVYAEQRHALALKNILAEANFDALGAINPQGLTQTLSAAIKSFIAIYNQEHPEDPIDVTNPTSVQLFLNKLVPWAQSYMKKSISMAFDDAIRKKMTFSNLSDFDNTVSSILTDYISMSPNYLQDENFAVFHNYIDRLVHQISTSPNSKVALRYLPKIEPQRIVSDTKEKTEARKEELLNPNGAASIPAYSSSLPALPGTTPSSLPALPGTTPSSLPTLPGTSTSGTFPQKALPLPSDSQKSWAEKSNDLINYGNNFLIDAFGKKTNDDTPPPNISPPSYEVESDKLVKIPYKDPRHNYIGNFWYVSYDTRLFDFMNRSIDQYKNDQKNYIWLTHMNEGIRILNSERDRFKNYLNFKHASDYDITTTETMVKYLDPSVPFDKELNAIQAFTTTVVPLLEKAGTRGSKECANVLSGKLAAMLKSGNGLLIDKKRHRATALDSPNYKPFGRLFLSLTKLSNSYLRLVYATGGPIAKFPTMRISTAFQNLLYDFMDKKRVSPQLVNHLSDKEQALFSKIMIASGLNSEHGIRLHLEKQDQEDLERLEVLKSMIEQGNDAPETMQETKYLIKKLTNRGLLKRISATKMLAAIA